MSSIMAPARGGQAVAHHSHIDGMRGIAIALVLLFHFELGYAQRGFLGVDIFFVISGFLVGGLIFRDLDSGAFNIFEFYRRRISRILPALVVVGLATLGLGWVLLLPDDFSRAADAVQAAILIHANEYYYHQTSYFSPTKYNKYFLHSWSLSVEEQFYIILPCLAFLLSTFRSYRAGIFGFLTLAGLALAVWGNFLNASAAFYFMPFRAWELLAGVWLATLQSDNPVETANSSILTVAGFTAMVAPAFLPKYLGLEEALAAQIICVCGTMLVISTNMTARGNPVSRLLSSQFLTFIGLISYSLYLIHWPVITLASNWAVMPLAIGWRLALLAASIALAWVCWRWIEVPIRRKANSNETRLPHVFGFSAAAIFSLIVITEVIDRHAGFPARLNSLAQSLLRGSQDWSPLRKQCHSDEETAPIQPANGCILGDRGSLPDTVVWSDSHGVELAYALSADLESRKRSLVQLTSSSCPPLLRIDVAAKPHCRAHNDAALAYIARSPNIRHVIVVMHYRGYPEMPESEIFSGLRSSVAELARLKKQVVLLAPLPDPPFDVPRGLARGAMHGWSPVPGAIPRDGPVDASGRLRSRIGELAQASGAVLVDPGDVLCSGSACPLARGGMPVFLDDNHLSMAGARIVTPLIASEIATAAP